MYRKHLFLSAAFISSVIINACRYIQKAPYFPSKILIIEKKSFPIYKLIRLYIRLDLSAIRAQQLPLYLENKNIIFLK